MSGSVTALAALAALPLTACLLVEPIEEEEIPPNYPPTFAPERASPPFEQEVVFDTQNRTEPIVFKVSGISDADTDDRVYWRWYTNYDARSFPLAAANGLTAGRAQGPDGVTVTYSLSPCDDLSTFQGRTLHRVELIVTDRPFLDDEATAGNRNQQLTPGAGQFRVVWYVEADLSRCPVAL